MKLRFATVALLAGTVALAACKKEPPESLPPEPAPTTSAPTGPTGPTGAELGTQAHF